MKTRKIVFFCVTVLALVAVIFVLKTLYQAGEFKSLEPHFDGKMRMVHGITGGEDITIDRELQIAFIAAHDWFAYLAKKQNKPGAIFRLDYTRPDARPVNLTAGFRQEFHPHGISLFQTAQGERLLFVVNHLLSNGGHAIEVFRYEDSVLTHLKTITGPLLISPNDVVAVSRNQFYATNDHGSRTESGKRLEEYLQLPRSNVVYFDGKKFRTVADGIAYANGINVSRDGKTLYVAATVGRKVLVYDCEPATGDLNLRQEVFLNTGVDNIEIGPAGDLWIGAHPKLLTFTKHAKDTARLSPSQVIRVVWDKAGNYTSSEVYLNAGEELSGSSVVAFDGHYLLIGPVLDDHILVGKVAAGL